MSADASLGIGALASATGVSVTALRYYDEVGLVIPAGRVGGKRRYETSAVGRVSFVRRAQEVGFSLDQIRDILSDTTGGWHDIVDVKLDELRHRRARLDTLIDVLTEVRHCGCEAVSRCPRFMDGE